MCAAVPFPTYFIIENPESVFTEPEYDLLVPEPPVVPDTDDPAFHSHDTKVSPLLLYPPAPPREKPSVIKPVTPALSVASRVSALELKDFVAPLTESTKK